MIAEKNGQPIRVRRPGPGDRSRTRTARWRSAPTGRDAVALTVFRRLGGDALTISRELEAVLADAPQVGAAGRRQSARCTIRRLLVRTAIANVRDAIAHRRVSSACVILLVFLQERPRHADRVAGHPAEPDDQLRVPAFDRRHAEPDVAGRPGGGHRADHRRHGGRRGEHRAAPGGRPDGRRGGGPGQQGNQRRGDRLDVDHDSGVRAAGVRARRGGAVLSVAEPGACRSRCWSRWSSA